MNAGSRPNASTSDRSPTARDVARHLGVTEERLRAFVDAHRAPGVDAVLAFAQLDEPTSEDREVVRAWLHKHVGERDTVEIDSQRLKTVLEVMGTQAVRSL